jgi:hypothetical protein
MQRTKPAAGETIEMRKSNLEKTAHRKYLDARVCRSLDSLILCSHIQNEVPIAMLREFGENWWAFKWSDVKGKEQALKVFKSVHKKGMSVLSILLVFFLFFLFFFF